MVFSILLLLGGAALAGSLMIGNEGSEPVECDGTSEDSENSENTVGDSDDPSGEGTGIWDVVFPEDPGATNPDDDGGLVEFELTTSDVASLPGPLSDWVAEAEVENITAGEDDLVYFGFSEDTQGELLIMPADYVEAGSDQETDEETTHTGLNVYFVPEGEDWPEDYEWLEDAATLQNTSGGGEVDEDFGTIRLVARISTGSFGTVIDAEGNVQSTFDATLGNPEIESNLEMESLEPMQLAS
ncbi:MAG: hypothetical protein GJ677_10710 [Rhodobacteraceae bacterium]|nr:hypothetical protein [Paracoccaceae bacterium]